MICFISRLIFVQLFEESKLITIKPRNQIFNVELPSDRPNEQSQPEYSAPFELTFPAASRCFCCCQLPPTLYSTSPCVKIRVEYIVIISVSQRVLCRIRRTKKVQRQLSLRSDPGLSIFPESSIGSLPASKLCPRMNEALHEVETSIWRNPDWLPRYTPSVQIEVFLPPPPILTTGTAIPIQIILHVPQELLDSERIYLRGILVQLRTSVSAVVGAMCGTCTDTVECWSSRGRVRVDKKRFELDSGMWGSFISLNARPTCKSCALDLIHSVDVIANISRGNDEEMQVSCVCPVRLV